MTNIIAEILRIVHIVSAATWRRLFVAFLAFVIPLLLFVQLADEVGEQETLRYDEQVLLAIYSLSSDTLDRIIGATTDLGYTWWVGLVTIVAVSLCVMSRNYKNALVVVVGVVGSAIINLLLKLFFQRDRPELWERLITENSYSFPSGHAMASASLAAVIIVILWPTKWRYFALTIGSVYVMYIGFTRMYLGVHYPTDIIAGWLVATSWVAITTIIVKKLYRWQT